MSSHNREQKVQQILTVLTNLSTNDIVNGILKQPDGPRRLREYMDFDARCGAVLRDKLKFSMIDLACQENTCFFVRDLINTSESREEAIELCKQLNPPDPLVFVLDDNNNQNNTNNINQHDPFAGPTNLLLHQQFLLQQQQQQQQGQTFIHTNNLLQVETQKSHQTQNQQLVRHVFQTNEVGAQMELLKATRELIEFIITEVDPDVLAPLIFSKAVDLVNGNPEVRGPLILFIEKCTDQERMIRGILLEKVLSPHFPTLMCSYNGSRFLLRHIMLRKDINNSSDRSVNGETQQQQIDSAIITTSSSNSQQQHDGRSIWMAPLWFHNGIRDNFEAICRSRFSGCEFVLEYMKRVTLDFFDAEIVPFFVRNVMMASPTTDTTNFNDAVGEDDAVPEKSDSSSTRGGGGVPAIAVGDENVKNFFIHDPQARQILEKIAATISETNRGGWLRKLIQALSTPSAFVNKAEKTVRALEDKFQRGEARKKTYNKSSSQIQQQTKRQPQLISEDYSSSSSIQQFSAVSMTSQNNANNNINNITNSRSGSNNANMNNSGDRQHSNCFSQAGSPNSQSQLNLSFPTFGSSSLANNTIIGNDPALAKFESHLAEIFSNSVSPSSFVDKMTPSQIEEFYHAAVDAANSLQAKYIKARTEERRERERAKQQQQQQLQQQQQQLNPQKTVPVAIASGSDYKQQFNSNNGTENGAPASKYLASSFVLLSPSTSLTIKAARSDQLRDFVYGLLASANAASFGLFPKLLRKVFGEIHQRQPPPMWIPLAFSSDSDREMNNKHVKLLPKIISMLHTNNNNTSTITQNQMRYVCDSVLALFESTIANIQFHRHCYLSQQQIDGFLASLSLKQQQQQYRHQVATNSTQPNAITMFNSSLERCNFVEEIICTLFDSVLVPFDTAVITNNNHNNYSDRNNNNNNKPQVSPFFAHAAAELLVNFAKLLIAEKEKESQRLALRRKREQDQERRGKQVKGNNSWNADDDEEEGDELLEHQQDKSCSEVVALRVRCVGSRNANELRESRLPTYLHIVNGLYWLLVIDWGFCRGKLRRILDNFVLFLGGAVHQASNSEFILQQTRHAAYFPFFVDQLFVPLIRTIPFDDPWNRQVIFPIAKSIFGVVFCRLHWDARKNNQASASSSSAPSPFGKSNNACDDGNNNNNDNMHSSFIQENFQDEEDDYFYQGSNNFNNNNNNSSTVDDFFDQQKSTLRPGEMRDAKIVGFDFLKNPTGFHYLVKSKSNNNNNNQMFDINAAVVLQSRKQQTNSKKNISADARRFLSVPFEENRLFLMNPVMLFNFMPKFLAIIPIEIVVDVVFTVMIPLLLVLRDEQRNGDGASAGTSNRSEYKTLKHVLFSSLQKTEGRINLFEHLAKYYGIDLENYEAPDVAPTNDNNNHINSNSQLSSVPSLLSSSTSSTSACISFPPPLLFDAEFGFPLSFYPDSSPICFPPPMILSRSGENAASVAAASAINSSQATPGNRRRPEQLDRMDDEHRWVNGSGQRRARE